MKQPLWTGAGEPQLTQEHPDHEGGRQRPGWEGRDSAGRLTPNSLWLARAPIPTCSPTMPGARWVPVSDQVSGNPKGMGGAG